MKQMEFVTRRQYDDDDSFDSISEYGTSYLEKNCNQIFMKGPAFTKEILGKMNADLVPNETYMCGYQFKTKIVFFAAGLCVLFSGSFFGFSLMWFTDIFDNYILSNIIISNSSNMYDMWVKPPPKLLYKVYLFNYTNVEKYKYGMDKKLHVEEIGPYVYQETTEKVNVKFNDDDTVSYQEYRSYVFQPKLSKGKQSDQVLVPNIPLLSGSAILRHHNYFARLAFSGIVTGLEQEAFIKLSADKFAMGYDDELYDLSSSLNKLLNVKTPEKFGLFAVKKGLQPKVFTVNTGRKDVNKMGVFEMINGAEELDLYSTSDCNSFRVTDGSSFPTKKIQRKQDLNFFFPQICRTMPLIFEKDVNILGGKIPAYQYTQPEYVFDSAEENPGNQCYCSDSGECAMKGVFNLTSCLFGSPSFISHPHFRRADPKLQNGVTGLNPNGRDYKVIANIHPIFGFLMTGSGSVQINIQVLKAYGMSQVDYLEDELMLPIAWFDVVLTEEDLPQEFVDLIYQATFTLKGVRLALEYGSLLTTVMTLICLILVLKRWWPCCKYISSMNGRTTSVPNENAAI